MPRVMQVIQSEEPRGEGVPNDPARTVTRYYTLEGDYLAEHDPCDSKSEDGQEEVARLRKAIENCNCDCVYRTEHAMQRRVSE